MDTYYLTEKPLTLVHADLMRTHCARSADEVQAVENVLRDFFVRTDEGYIHKRCDVEIEAFHAKSTSASESAKARWARAKKEKEANAMRTHSEGNANHKPITNNHKPVKSIGVSAPTEDKFQLAWKSYPKREGANPKNKALSAWNARIKEGVNPDAMLAGVQRYEAFSKAKGNIGTGYVMQAVRFFGTERAFENEWAVSAVAGKPNGVHHGFDNIDYSAGLVAREDGTLGL
jgi:uncharacterized protein YdaU (DUF1376 family)